MSNTTPFSPQACLQRTKSLSSIQPSLRQRIARFFSSLFAPVAEAKVADLSTCQVIREAIDNFDISVIERFIPHLSIDRKTMGASVVASDEIVLLKPINERESGFKIDAKLHISALHEHLGVLASHNLRLAGTILENRQITWNYATLI
jgi:hypothetical protein